MLPCHIHDIVHCQHLLGGARHSIQVQWDVHSHSRGLAAKACDGKCTCRDSENAYAVSLYEVSQQSWEGPELPQDQAQGSQRLPCVKSLRPKQSVRLTLSPAILHQTIAVAQSTRAWNDISNMYCTLALRPWTARTQDSVRILLRPRLVMSKMSISYLVCFRGGVADPATLRMHHRFSLLCVSFCILSCWGGWSSHPNMKIIDFHCFLLDFVCFRVGVVDPATLAHGWSIFIDFWQFLYGSIFHKKTRSV